jgi:hypothetical protein
LKTNRANILHGKKIAFEAVRKKRGGEGEGEKRKKKERRERREEREEKEDGGIAGKIFYYANCAGCKLQSESALGGSAFACNAGLRTMSGMFIHRPYFDLLVLLNYPK